MEKSLAYELGRDDFLKGVYKPENFIRVDEEDYSQGWDDAWLEDLAMKMIID
jgi:hypothetical protein